MTQRLIISNLKTREREVRVNVPQIELKRTIGLGIWLNLNWLTSHFFEKMPRCRCSPYTPRPCLAESGGSARRGRRSQSNTALRRGARRVVPGTSRSRTGWCVRVGAGVGTCAGGAWVNDEHRSAEARCIRFISRPLGNLKLLQINVGYLVLPSRCSNRERTLRCMRGTLSLRNLKQ